MSLEEQLTTQDFDKYYFKVYSPSQMRKDIDKKSVLDICVAVVDLVKINKSKLFYLVVFLTCAIVLSVVLIETWWITGIIWLMCFSACAGAIDEYTNSVKWNTTFFNMVMQVAKEENKKVKNETNDHTQP